MKIFKYVLKHGFYTEMPKGAELLSIGQQGNDIVCWAIVDPDQKEIVGRKIAVYGTGHEMNNPPGKFIGTVQLIGALLGGLVFHAFDEGEATRSE